MNRLITAEFRKILTTKLWWGLLLPAALLAFGWSFGFGKIAAQLGQDARDSEVLRQSGYTFQDLALSVFAITRAINISTVFPMLFGAIGLAVELHRKTITTSFLTAPSRSALLSAKAIVYAVWGVIFGVVISGLSILGSVAGTGGTYLPDATGFLLLFGAGVLASVLWTLLGLGVGAIVGSTTGSVLLLVIYAVIGEPILALVLHNHAVGVLPNGSADGLTGATAAQIIVDQLQTHSHTPLVQVVGADVWNAFLNIVRIAAGAIGSFDWWLSGLIFLGWTAVFFVIGIIRNQTRDIT